MGKRRWFPSISFVREENTERSRIRIGFTASAAGIVASFLVLAIVVSLFAANLLGYFQLALPSVLMNGLTDKSQGTSLMVC
jgi:thiol:disulfide interchange protein